MERMVCLMSDALDVGLRLPRGASGRLGIQLWLLSELVAACSPENVYLARISQ